MKATDDETTGSDRNAGGLAGVNTELARSDQGRKAVDDFISPAGAPPLVQFELNCESGLTYSLDSDPLGSQELSVESLFYAFGCHGGADFEDRFFLYGFIDFAYSNIDWPSLSSYTRAMACFARGAFDTGTEAGNLAAAVAVVKASYRAMKDNNLEALQLLRDDEMLFSLDPDTGDCFGLLALAVLWFVFGLWDRASHYCTLARFQASVPDDDFNDAPSAMIQEMTDWITAKNEEA